MSSNLKVNTILPSTGTAIGIGTAAGNVDILGHIVGHNTPNISGINSVTANHFYGDISNATGAAAGLGTALSQDQSNPLNKLYYTDRILSIGSTVTIDHPASATGAYTQYADILVEDNADLIVADGDDLIPDILGLGGNGTTGAGGAGRLLVDNIVNRSGTGAPSFPNGAVVTGVVTATTFSGSGASLTSLPAANRNFIINGAMQFWQRGTTFNTQGNGQNDYTADRWGVGHNNSHMAAVTQQDGTGAHAKFPYCARVQRDSGQSQTDQMRFHTALETNDVILLRGEVLTLSYYARKGANFSPSGSKFSQLIIYTGTNTDGDPNAFSGGNWTNATAVLDTTSTPTLTTSWQRFSHTTSAVSNSANSMIIEFRISPTGTAGANDYYEITGVQLEIGSSMTAFEHRRYSDELARCERFFQTGRASIGSAYNGFGGNQVQSTYIGFNTKMRAQPTISFGTNHATNNVVNADYYGGEGVSGFSYRVNLSGNGNYARYSTYFAEAEL